MTGSESCLVSDPQGVISKRLKFKSGILHQREAVLMMMEGEKMRGFRMIAVEKANEIAYGAVRLGMVTGIVFAVSMMNPGFQTVSAAADISAESALVEDEETELISETSDEYAEELFLQGVQYDMREEYEEAIEYFLKAADLGYVNAQYVLGWKYHFGDGIEQDYEEAAKYYQLAADQGHALAQTCIGHCYLSGRGVEQDYAKAFAYFQLAAIQGEETSFYNLGKMYEQGLGIEQDYSKAEEYYQKALELGYMDAAEALARVKQFAG